MSADQPAAVERPIIALLDREGNVRSVSPAIVGLTGHPAHEVIGRRAADLVHPEDLASWETALHTGAGDGMLPLPLECRLRGTAGGWVRVEVEVSRLHDPIVPTVLVIRRNAGAVADRLRRLGLAIEQSPAAVIITDAEGRIEYVNRRFTEMTGYLPEDVLGRTPRVLKSDRTPADAYERLWATILAGDVWRGELCNRRKDGELYWHSASISPVRDAAGRVSGFVAVQEDITGKRRVAEELAAREAEYRRVVETATEGIWGVDADHRTTFVNERMAAMLGYTVAEMLGRPVFDFTDEEGRVIAEASRSRRQAGIREQLDFKLLRRDGSPLWVLMSTGPVLDDAGRYRGALAMVTDLTERRGSEAALRRSEAWFRTLIEGTEELIAVVGADGLFRYASPSHERVLGRRPADLIGHNAIELVHPDDRAGVLAALRAGAREHHAVRSLQFRFLHQNGTWRLIDGIGRGLFDDPVVGGVVLNSRDVTERAALEAQFRQAQKMEAVGRLVGGVAHDFNNILAVIQASSDMLADDLPPDHASREDVLEIRKAGERAAALTRQLLAFTRQQVLVPRVLDLGELVRGMEGMLARLLGEDIECSMVAGRRPATLLADPGQLEQVVLNLAVNARDAMPGGGRLMIETAVVELDDVYVERHMPMQPGPHVMLSVTDTGVGISAADQARVFEPFFTTKPPGKGTGLGLSTVYGIVKQSGGFVWLYSEPGMGTTFRIYLPHVDQAADRTDAPPQTPGPLRGTETILIAEDNPAVAHATRRALERCGYTVLEARGEEAIDLVRRHQGTIHLLLSDVVMPGLSGPQLVQAVRAVRPELRVLFMSGYGDAAMRALVAEAGGGYLQKPFTIDSLARKVREVLDAPSPADAG